MWNSACWTCHKSYFHFGISHIKLINNFSIPRYAENASIDVRGKQKVKVTIEELQRVRTQHLKNLAAKPTLNTELDQKKKTNTYIISL